MICVSRLTLRIGESQEDNYCKMWGHPLIAGSILLLYQSLFSKPLKNKHEPLFGRQHRYPHNIISQGAVIADDPLIQKTCMSVILESETVQLERESVEDKYRSIAIVEAIWQNLVRVQSKDPVPRQGTRNGSVEKGDISR
jgi:hypothetical protein